ncbi:MAG: hypothetical protein Q9174_002370 [Haloplaca sp. 1 TL-2023]
MRGACIGIIKASKSPAFPIGSYATGTVGWTEYAIANEKDLEKIEIPKDGRVTDALGVLGMTGLTAYFGLLDVGKVRAGDFVVVSGAAGATGSVVGQIAKLKGATVLGIAGSDDKVDWLKNELGFDNALNYKDEDFAKKFRDATKAALRNCPELDRRLLRQRYASACPIIHNATNPLVKVGGEVLDLALSRAKQRARFVICGVFDYASQYTTARAELAKWLSEGKIKRKETIIKGGLRNAEKGLADLYRGVNTGKLLVQVSPDEGNKDAGAMKSNL